MIPIKSPKEIKIMREGGKILAEIMEKLKSKVAPGVTGKELDRVAETLVLKYGAEPAFKGYEGFPATLCASVNNVIVHAVPSDYKLRQGDLLSLDLGIKYKGFYTDMAITTFINPQGVVSSKLGYEAGRLIRVTKKALKLGIKKTRVGNTFGDIGNTIQRFVEYQGFNVVRELCGHGIGKDLHESPKIPNYGKRRSGHKLLEGMVFCIEPMTTIGDWHLKKSPDTFGFETKDGSLSCHFEHTVAVTKTGPQILTQL